MIGDQPETWHILYIEDDEEDFILARAMLSQSQGRQIFLEWATTFEDGRAKLSGSLAKPYDAVLVDYDLGCQTGIEIIREFSTIYPTPLILYTGRGSYEVDLEAMSAGAALYLTKRDINSLIFERFIRYAIETRRVKTALDLNVRQKSIILESIQDGIIGMDRDWRITFINARAAHNSGYKPTELIGRNFWETFPRVLGSIFEMYYRKAMETRVVQTFHSTGIYQSQYYNITIYPSEEGISVYWQDISESRQSEAALKESEEKFRTLANLMDQLAWMSDSTGARFWFNQRWLDYTDTTLEEMKGMGWQKVHHPDYLPIAWEKMQRSFAESETWEDIYPLRGKNGQYRWFLSRAQPIKDENGKVFRWFGTNTDITEQRELQQQLENERARLEAVLQALPVAVWIADPNGRLIAKNPQADRLYAGNTPMPTNIADYQTYRAWWPDTGKEVKAEEWPLARTLLTGKPCLNVEIEIERLDGTRGTVLVSSALIRDTRGKTIGGVVVDLDITGRKQIQKDLQIRQEELTAAYEEMEVINEELVVANEELMQQNELIDLSFEPIFTRDLSGTILTWNRGCEQLYGYPRVEAVGQNSHAFLQTIFPVSLEDTIIKLRNTGAWTGDLIHRTKDRREVFVESKQKYIETRGRYIVIEANHDITERKKNEESLRHYTAELERLNQALRDFTSIAAHDLQEPLRKVQSFGDILDNRYRDQLGEDGRDLLNRITSAAARMNEMLQDLLSYSRITSQAKPFMTVDLQQIAQEVLSDLVVRIDETNGKVEIGNLPAIQADPIQMQQLFQNLISNALKYHHPDRPPLVKVGFHRTTDGMIEIEITDNGMGFEMRYAEKIFEPFVRIEGKGNKNRGTGMGLAICKKIVERHNGEIYAISTPGIGSTFTITLPLKQSI